MKKTHKLSLQITATVSLFSIFFGVVFLFVFSDFVSLKDFSSSFFSSGKLFWKDVGYLYVYVFVKIIAITVWIYGICLYFIKKIYAPIELYNQKLTDYNHYLAHELKTPLSIVHSYLDMMKHDKSLEIIEKSQKEITSITQVIDRLLYVADSLRVSEKKHVNIERLLRKCIWRLSQKKQDGIKVSNKEFNFSVYTDEILLERIVSNLVENSCKYSSDALVQIDITDSRIIIKNSVSKNIPKEDIEKIYTKFYTSGQGREKWYGIGLSLISEISKALWYKLEISCHDKVFQVQLVLD